MYYILAGILGGIIGGMGMGGGTLLIPILTLGLGVTQRSAQLLNTIAFLPMALLTSIINARKGLIKWRHIIYVGVSGTITAILSSYLVGVLDAKILRYAFAIFLVILGIYSIISTIVKIVKKKRSRCLTSINVKRADDE